MILKTLNGHPHLTPLPHVWGRGGYRLLQSRCENNNRKQLKNPFQSRERAGCAISRTLIWKTQEKWSLLPWMVALFWSAFCWHWLRIFKTPDTPSSVTPAACHLPPVGRLFSSVLYEKLGFVWVSCWLWYQISTFQQFLQLLSVPQKKLV